MTGCGHGRSLNLNTAAAILLAVLLGNLAISARCTKQQPLGFAGGGRGRGTTAAAAAGHEDGYGSKIYLIFCQRSKCVDDGHEFTCYCCLHWNSVCWMTMEDCRSSCPVCNPKCHQPLPLAVRRRSPTIMAGCPPW